MIARQPLICRAFRLEAKAIVCGREPCISVWPPAHTADALSARRELTPLLQGLAPLRGRQVRSSAASWGAV